MVGAVIVKDGRIIGEGWHCLLYTSDAGTTTPDKTTTDTNKTDAAGGNTGGNTGENLSLIHIS